MTAFGGLYAGRRVLVTGHTGFKGSWLVLWLRSLGAQVVGLALDTHAAVLDFLGNVPVYYPIVLETPGPADASVRLGNTQGLLPYSVLIDADGRVVKQKLGPFKAGEIEEWVGKP